MTRRRLCCLQDRQGDKDTTLDEDTELSDDEMETYTELKEAVKIRSHIADRRTNDEAQADFENVLKELVDFEALHNCTGDSRE